MASAFFRSRWAAVAFLVGGIITMFYVAPSFSSPSVGIPALVVGLLMFLAAFPLYNYFTFKGMCQASDGKGVWGTMWRTAVNGFTLGLYGFIVYDPLDEEEAQMRYDEARKRRREERRALRENLRRRVTD